MIGSTLSHYRITAKLGAGGMGEVYRATDTKLEREVAIKVLPPIFTEDPERLARFEREAKLLAQLNHPNIAQIHGLETEGETRALVMELVEGPTLADQMGGGALPAGEALSLARQIAGALEEAHGKGIIHRDLKPQNVKLSSGGAVKVLDFGLAKAMDPVGAASGAPSQSRLAASPTLTLGATVQGVILGTAAYMSPEQARGGAADKRADIWAFGVVLWEMLTGRSLFTAETVSDTLAAVLRADVDLDAVPETTPPAIRRLLRRCLERNPKNRLHDIADARIVIDEVLAGASEPAPTPPVTTAGATWRILPWAIAALAWVAVAVAWIVGSAAGSKSASLFADLGAPEGERFQFQGDFGAPLVLSRDGTQVAFGAVGSDSRTRLWVRSLVSGEAKRFDRTEGATAPFFSYDGKSLGYFVNAKLMVAPIAGGAPYPVADAPNGRGGAWTPDGTIVFAPDFRSALLRVAATGGRPEPLTTVDAARHSTHRWPVLTPDGKAIVYLAANHAGNRQDESELRWLRLDGSGDRALVSSRANGVIAGGELLYLREQTLLARPIDAAGELGGEARTLAPELLYDPSTWRSAFAASADHLLYAPGGKISGTHLTRVDHSGHSLAELAGAGDYLDLRLSPDGKRLAVTKGQPNDIWLLDLERGTQSRLTFDKESEISMENSAVWSHDGRWIYYARSAGQNISQQIVRKASNGAGGVEVFYDTKSGQQGIFPLDESPDGKWLLVTTGQFPFIDDAAIQWLALDGSQRLVPLIEADAVINFGRISPDGRWVVFTSNESGITQIYVMPASHGGGATPSAKWQLSLDGGTYPIWSRDGKEVVYLEPSLNLSRVTVSGDGAGGLRFGTPEPLFGTTLVADQASFDLAPDGQSLILNHYGESQSQPLRLVENWRRLLER